MSRGKRSPVFKRGGVVWPRYPPVPENLMTWHAGDASVGKDGMVLIWPDRANKARRYRLWLELESMLGRQSAP